MSSKIFLDSSIKYVPQMDINVVYTENGGIEATQTFIARRSSLGTSDLNGFNRGTRWETLYPEVPSLYRSLTMKTFDPQDTQPGIIAIKATFTGYQWEASYGSSGEEEGVPTTSLRPCEEHKSITNHAKWNDLTAASKNRLGWLMTLPGTVSFNLSENKYGKTDEDGAFTEFPTGPGVWAIPEGDELEFAKMIAEGETTYKAPSWSYVYRTEGKKPFTAAQLNQAFKIVANPPGEPVDPGTGWTWMLIAPEQTQSGPDRFIKDLTFQLIEDNPRNQFLYGS